MKPIEEVLKVLGDANRLEIIKLLIQGETCGCTLIDKLPISQPTLSYHLKTLTDAGLTTAKREGNWIKHYVDKQALSQVIDYLTQLRDSEETACKL